MEETKADLQVILNQFFPDPTFLIKFVELESQAEEQRVCGAGAGQGLRLLVSVRQAPVRASL